MTIRATVDDFDDGGLVVLRFSGSIHPSEVAATASEVLKKIGEGKPYRELLVFARDTDLSDFTPQALAECQRRCDAARADLRLGQRTAAAATGISMEAKLIMPLFNALAGTPDVRIELFEDAKAALRWLSVPVHEGLALIEGLT